ncbi:hypothetical protein ACM0P6_10195 [Komagataeibacter sucrofermentans]|nr:hypothetical protein [Komagataeibacter sucrofermentans]
MAFSLLDGHARASMAGVRLLPAHHKGALRARLHAHAAAQPSRRPITRAV